MTISVTSVSYVRVCIVLYLLSHSFFFNDTATTEIYTLSLHDALPISRQAGPDTGADDDNREIRGVDLDLVGYLTVTIEPVT